MSQDESQSAVPCGVVSWWPRAERSLLDVSTGLINYERFFMRQDAPYIYVID